MKKRWAKSLLIALLLCGTTLVMHVPSADAHGSPSPDGMINSI